MLTSDLSRYKLEGDIIKPLFILRKDSHEYVKAAEDIIRIYKRHIGRRRIELENELERYESDKIDYKIYRGLAKIIDGMCDFNPGTTMNSEEVRRIVFDLSSRKGPVVKNTDLLHKTTRNDVIHEAAGIVRCSRQEVENALFGDLAENYILERIKGLLTPGIIIKRYNLALAQVILYKALDMKIKLYGDYKTVFKYIGLSQLMYTAKKMGDRGYFIEVTGPLSLFRSTHKYGIRFARFLAGLALAREWEMTSRIETRYGIKTLKLSSGTGLKSFYAPDKIFDSSFERNFYTKFIRRSRDWTIKRESEIIDLNGEVLVPDFVFYHKNGARVFFEIIGFWTPEYIAKKTEKLNKIKRGNFIIAIRKNLNCSKDEFKRFSGNTIFFTTGIKLKEILHLLNKFTN